MSRKRKILTESEIRIRLDELENHGVEHCAGHSDAPGSCGTCTRIAELKTLLAPPASVLSRSVLRREALQKGKPMPTFTAPKEPQADAKGEK